MIPVPVDVEGICLYIVHLTKTVCYVTIANYVTGVYTLHDYLGISHPDSSGFIIQSTLRGAKRLLGSASKLALPLTPRDLINIYHTLDLSISQDRILWCALVLAFRCLLRVGHVTASPHQLQVGDIKFREGGFDLTIRSSKTVQFRERINVVPVQESPSSLLCPVRVLRDYLTKSKKLSTSPLFKMNYNVYAARLKKACKAIGLVGQYTTHSIRRGAASYLATFLPLHDVKTYGDWRSWAVLLYLSDTYDSRRSKDDVVAGRLAEFV